MYHHRDPKYAYVEEWRAAVEKEAKANGASEGEPAVVEPAANGAEAAGQEAPAALTAVEKGEGRAGLPQIAQAEASQITTTFTPVNASQVRELEPAR